jgi:hypothetical protein
MEMRNHYNPLRGCRLVAMSFRLWAVSCIILGAIGLLTGCTDAVAFAVAAGVLLILLTLPRPPYLGPHQ